MDIYLLHYNNYYNRRLRVERRAPVLSDYTPYILGGSSGVIHNVNFNPRNEIDTSVVIGSASQLWQREWGDADYLLEVDPDTSTIISRWFVVSQDRIRSGQYNLALHRDIIADNLDKVLASPMFVEKGYVTVNDPAIFNKENMTFNQIKQSQYLLKDRTNTAWIVGYLARLDKYDADGKPQEESDQSISIYNRITPDYVYNNLADFPLAEYTAVNNSRIVDTIYQYSYIRINGINGAGDKSLRFQVSDYGQDSTLTVDWKDTYYQIDSSGDFNSDIFTILQSLDSIRPDSATMCTYLTNQTTGIFKTPDYYNEIVSQYDGKIIFINDGMRYFKVSFTLEDSQLMNISPTSGSAWETNIDSEILKITIPNSSGQMIHTGSSETNRIATNYGIYTKKFYMKLTQVLSTSSTAVLTGTISKNHKTTTDAAYDIFFIPYNSSSEAEIQIKAKNGKTYNNDSALSMRLAMEIARTYSSRLYDCQILPYCPEIQKFINSNNQIDLSSSTIYNGVDYTLFTNEESELTSTVLLWASSAWFNLTINSPLQITQPSDPVEFKIERETNIYRLCSPNWNGQFEFSPLGNRGLSQFNIDCNYKPGQPYIHINPVFNKRGLYTSSSISLNDARGLILNGDFSISMTQSSLQNYTLQNKNYQNIFDRNIENLEFNQKQERTQALISGISGAAGSTVGSVATIAGGVASGNGFAIAQGSANLARGIVDPIVSMAMLDAKQKETLDYTKDLYTMNMGNISATPNSLTRVSALNNNNTLYPVLEVYSATSQEQQALRNKIKYNGMTINRIGTLTEFVPYKRGIETYFKGKLIRNEDIKGSYDYLIALASELNQGVFIDNKIFNT